MTRSSQGGRGDDGGRRTETTAALPADGEVHDLRARAGYRGPAAARAAGITYRQLDHWARARLVEPSLHPQRGEPVGSRLYDAHDVLVLTVVRRLMEAGVCLHQVRTTASALRGCAATADLHALTLMCDGASVYPCTSADEVIELVQGGQGVFGIAVGRVWSAVLATLASVPAEHPDGRGPLTGGDELAERRAARATG